MRAEIVVLLALLGGSLVAGPVLADRLVTRAGATLETDGPWEVRGKLVVWTTTDGELRSMRLSEVDLEASQEATAAAKRPPKSEKGSKAAAPPPRREPVMRLTDADFSRRSPLVETASEEASEEGAEPADQVAVLAWEDASGPDGVVLTGRLANRSSHTVARLRLTVRLLDVDGEVIVERDADLSATSLVPRGLATFRAEFPETLAFAEEEFEIDYVPLLTGSDSALPEEDTGPEEESEEPASQGR